MRDRSELDRLSSDNIKSVEVISNPGARYAASTKAVIRITTKKIQGDGFGFDATTEGSYDEKKNIGGSSNIYYVGKVGKLGIDFNTDWFWSKGNNKNNIDEHYQEVNSDMQNQLVNSTTSKYNRLIASKMVLSYPLLGGDLSVGGEYSFINRNTNYAIIPNTLADNVRDRIKEGMYSAFVTYSRDFGKLNMEAGLRYENVDFKYYDNGKYMAEQSKTYGEWFPSLSLSMPIGNVQMQLSYAADINRPNYWVLRSGVQYSNHYTYETGNPFLVSEISRNTSYDLAYKWLTFNLTYEHVSNPKYQTVEMYKDNATIGLMRMINGKSYNIILTSL